MARRSSAARASADDHGDELVDALAQTAFVVVAMLTRIAAEHDVSLTQMRVLGVLRDRRPRMAQLAELLGLDKSTMSGLIDRSEQRGLVARVRSVDDARAVEVVLTAAGIELADRGHAEVRDALAPFTDRLGSGDQLALTNLLQQLLAGPPP